MIPQTQSPPSEEAAPPALAIRGGPGITICAISIRPPLVILFLVAAVLAVAVSADRAVGASLELWAPDYAGDAILDSGLPVDAAQCVGVGPVVHRHGSNLFAELACTTGGADSPQQLLAIKPETDTTFVQLDPGKPRPPGQVVTSTSPDGQTQPIVAINEHLHEIELLDDSLWKLADPRGILIGWRGDDKVTIQPGNFYNVVDVTRHELLPATFEGFTSGQSAPGVPERTAPGSPVTVALRVVRAEVAGNDAPGWAALHPADQAVVSKARFEACQAASRKAAGSRRVADVSENVTTSATQSVPPIGTAFVYDVELIVTYETHSKVPNGLTRLELYFVPYKDKRVEVLTAADYRAYKAGRCP